jgi:hypothetical protein
MHQRNHQDSAKTAWQDNFLFKPLRYDVTPPPPLDGATIIKPSMDVEALVANRLFSAELAAMNPLLLPADMGMPPDKLFLLKAEMAH